MESLLALFGENDAVTLILIVLGLAAALVLLFWIFRKLASGNSVRASRNRQPRLSVTDAAVVDDKRRLVLVRRDNVEHLVMIGGLTDFVIEQNIDTSESVLPKPSGDEIAGVSTEPEFRPRIPSPPQIKERPTTRNEATGKTNMVETGPAPRPIPARVSTTAAGTVGAGTVAAGATVPPSEPPASDWRGSQPSDPVKPTSPNSASDWRGGPDKDGYVDLEREFAELGDEIEATSIRESQPGVGTGSAAPLPQSRSAVHPDTQMQDTQEAPVSGDHNNTQTESEMEDEMQKLLNELAKA